MTYTKEQFAEFEELATITIQQMTQSKGVVECFLKGDEKVKSELAILYTKEAVEKNQRMKDILLHNPNKMEEFAMIIRDMV